MKIAMLAPLVEKVPPDGYGGTELVVHLLCEELVSCGHEVTLFACEGSKVPGTLDASSSPKTSGSPGSAISSGPSSSPGRLVTCAPQSLRGFEPPERWAAYDIRAVLELERRLSEFDIVHNHMGWQALPLLDRLGCGGVKRTSIGGNAKHPKIVTTNHNPIGDYCVPIYLAYKHMPYVALSHAYHKLNYPAELNYVGVVHNGIDVQAHTYNLQVRTGNTQAHTMDANAHASVDPQVHAGIQSQTRNLSAKRFYLLFIGRICANKGAHIAIQIALRLGVPIKIAGKIDARDTAYFEEEVKPYINNPLVELVGELGFEEKIRLYNEAIAVVYPVQFDEPFGLVMVEALACGTPVMALNRGAVSEVLSDDTAIIGNTIDDLVNGYPRVCQIDHAACRKRAESLFSKKRMVQDYEWVYAKLLG